MTEKRIRTFLDILTNSMELSILERPSIVQPLENLPALYGTRRFIIAFSIALNLFLS
jgi:hypothetical protein